MGFLAVHYPYKKGTAVNVGSTEHVSDNPIDAAARAVRIIGGVPERGSHVWEGTLNGREFTLLRRVAAVKDLVPTRSFTPRGSDEQTLP